MTELPEDAVALLRTLTHVDPDDWREAEALRNGARELLRRHGVVVETVEEELRSQIAQLGTETRSLEQRLRDARGTVENLTRVNQERGRKINEYRARIHKLEAEQRLNVSVGAEQLVARARTLLAAADIPAEVTITEKEVTDAAETAPTGARGRVRTQRQ